MWEFYLTETNFDQKSHGIVHDTHSMAFLIFLYNNCSVHVILQSAQEAFGLSAAVPSVITSLSSSRKLYVKAEENNISILHHVILTFHADKTFLLRTVVGTAV